MKEKEKIQIEKVKMKNGLMIKENLLFNKKLEGKLKIQIIILIYLITIIIIIKTDKDLLQDKDQIH